MHNIALRLQDELIPTKRTSSVSCNYPYSIAIYHQIRCDTCVRNHDKYRQNRPRIPAILWVLCHVLFFRHTNFEGSYLSSVSWQRWATCTLRYVTLGSYKYVKGFIHICTSRKTLGQSGASQCSITWIVMYMKNVNFWWVTKIYKVKVKVSERWARSWSQCTCSQPAEDF